MRSDAGGSHTDHGLARRLGIEACFGAGTPLRKPTGSATIETLRVGDLVLSRDEFDPLGPVVPRMVEDVFVRESLVWSLKVGGRTIRTTAEHPFYVEDRGWTATHDLRVGDTILGEGDSATRVEAMDDTGEWATVYNLRVAEHHTYFVGCDEWGFSVWAHNAECTLVDDAGRKILRERDTGKVLIEGKEADVSQFLKANPEHTVVDEATAFYHGTNRTRADDITARGIDLSESRDYLDFGRGFYTTRDLEQAMYWATKNHGEQGAVVRFEVLKSRLGELQTRDFGRTVTVDWQTAVWQGRNGILDTTPLPFDMVGGLMITNKLTPNATSMFKAKGTGNQQAWTTADAVRILQEQGAVIR